jgi:DNA-directed RNA polymerase specialized sigma24 family protein
MTVNIAVAQEDFDHLLSWLDRDRDTAGHKYETIRARLIKLFVCRGCYEAEDLADETINRVAKKARQLSSNYSGDPTNYFYGVARNILLETSKKRYKAARTTADDPAIAPIREEHTPLYDCLVRCLQELAHEQRELILDYYDTGRRKKVGQRKQLAEELGIGGNALRLRTHRIRNLLLGCMKNCMSSQIA